MEQMDTESGVLAGIQNGSPPRPEAEKQRDTTAPAGEASREALGNNTDDGVPFSPAETSLSVPIALVRATMPLRIEAWRLLASEPEREAHARKRCGGRKSCAACALTFALYDVQRSCAQIANLTARACERLDGAAWDEAKLAARGGKPVVPKPWPSDKVNHYRIACDAHPSVLTGIVSAVTKSVSDKWRRERWDVLARSERSAARYRAETMPIPMRAADVRVIETSVRNVFELHCSLSSGRSGQRGKQFTVPIKAKDQRQYNTLREIVEGSVRMGALSIKRDRNGKYWELRVAYKRVTESARGAEKLGAINRGIANLLVAVTEQGERLTIEGRDVEAYLAQMHSRRVQYQNAWNTSGRKGRGRLRALGPTMKLEAKATRWRKTWIQTHAREVARWFQARGVTRVLIDDLKGIRDGAIDALEGGKPVWDRVQRWPYFETGQRLASCLDELGIAHEEKDCAFGSRDCPRCGHRHEARDVTRHFKCSACGHYDRSVDAVLGLNLISRERTRMEQDKK